MPYSLEVRLVRLIFLQGGIADANFKSCHAIVLGINNSPVEYCLIALWAEDLVDLAPHLVWAISGHHLQQLVIHLDVQQLLPLFVLDSVLKARIKAIASAHHADIVYRSPCKEIGILRWQDVVDGTFHKLLDIHICLSIIARHERPQHVYGNVKLGQLDHSQFILGQTPEYLSMLPGGLQHLHKLGHCTRSQLRCFRV